MSFDKITFLKKQLIQNEVTHYKNFNAIWDYLDLFPKSHLTNIEKE